MFPAFLSLNFPAHTDTACWEEASLGKKFWVLDNISQFLLCMCFCNCDKYVIFQLSTSLFNPNFSLYFGPFKTYIFCRIYFMAYASLHKCDHIYYKNISKGTTDPRVEFISQDHSSQIMSILQFQNLDKAFSSKSQPNISISTKSKVKILTKPCFRI